MRAAFYEASSFDHALSSWDVMFNRADYFNQPLSTWDVSNAKQMSYMFFGAFFFGQNLCDWGSLVNVSDTPEVDVTGLWREWLSRCHRTILNILLLLPTLFLGI
jgi:Mycoplasma protein of unknown function, DUF285